MAQIQWVKLATDLFDNRKIKYLLSLPRGCEMLVFWVRLLCLCGRTNRGGMLYFTQNKPYDAARLAIECDLPESLITRWLDCFEDLEMLVREQGIIRLLGWEEYQSSEKMDLIREQNRMRMRALRERKRDGKEESEAINTGNRSENTEKQYESQCCDANRVHTSVTVTQRDAAEEEREKEKEKESLSLSLPREEAEKAFRERTLLGGRLGRGRVLLSEEQINDLLERLSLEEFDRYVSAVAECEEKGKSFRRKTHYQAILDMARRDRGTI